jgi:endonuclease-3
MDIEERYRKVIEYFEEYMPVAETELEYSDPFSLLVSVILSAQCTDKRVNTITPALMDSYPNPEAMAAASQQDIYNFIKSCSYPNSKARYLSETSRKIVTDYQGKVPENLEELIKLPGVGRKTANVISLIAFGNPAMPVDTHVFRVSERLGLTLGARTPESAEKQLVMHFKPELLSHAHHWLILHGRYVCQSRKPKCNECGLKEICLFYNNPKSK